MDDRAGLAPFDSTADERREDGSFLPECREIGV
jgi:hypothetical protein